MTCTVAVANRGRVWMAADSSFTGDDGSLVTCRDPKCWREGRMLIGMAGSGLWWTVLRRHVVWPAVPVGASTAALDEWAQVELLAAIAAGQASVGFADTDYEAIIGAAGRLWEIASDRCAYRRIGDYAAIGSGAQPAAGVLFDLKSSRAAPREKLTRALRAAVSLRSDVRGPFCHVSC